MRAPSLSAFGFAAAFALACAACATAQERPPMTGAANSIQPETTLSISARASVEREPDIAFLTAGVQTEAETAEAAMAQNAARMTAVFAELKKAGVAERDMQTSDFSLQPKYDYSSSGNRPPRLVGYTASNQLTVRARDLDRLGETMDALVGAGGNTFSGLRFALDDSTAAEDEARGLAMKEALARAELYAKAAGYKVARIVSIQEQVSYQGPKSMRVTASRAADMEAAATPVAAGEIGYEAAVDIVFELEK